MPAVALVTARTLSKPDLDAAPLAEALAAEGVEARAVAWDDPAVDWGAFALAVLRSTWNYHRQPDAFLAWVDAAGGRTRLHNPPELVRWNAHKGYLLELAARGLPVAPLALLRRGSRAALAEVAAAQGWDEVVVKPAVSAGSFATVRARADDPVAAAHLAALVRREDALVGRFLPAVVDEGERSVVLVDGAPTHAVTKRARFMGDPERVEAATAAPDEEALARRVVAAAAPGALYARVDVARGLDGRPCLMELEVIEPSLFFRLGPGAAARLARAIAARLG